MTTNEEPKLVNGEWTCPAGYGHPKCPGCGHNYFSIRPRPIVEGKYPNGGLCKWCIEEQNES